MPLQGLTGAGRHKSIIAYLSANNLQNTAAALREELGLSEETLDAGTVKKYEGLLEKKWTSVVRLQKKVRRPQQQPASFPISCLVQSVDLMHVIDHGARIAVCRTPVRDR